LDKKIFCTLIQVELPYLRGAIGSNDGGIWEAYWTSLCVKTWSLTPYLKWMHLIINTILYYCESKNCEHKHISYWQINFCAAKLCLFTTSKRHYQKTVQFPFVQLPSHLMKYLTENTTIKGRVKSCCAKKLAEANKWYKHVPNHGTLPLKHRKRNQYPTYSSLTYCTLLYLTVIFFRLLCLFPLPKFYYDQSLLFSDFSLR